MKPKRLAVTWNRTPPMICPACHAVLQSATGFSGDVPIRPTVGQITLCDQCFTFCTFVMHAFPTPTLGLRLATTEEIERVDESMRELALKCAAFISDSPRH